MGRDRPVIGAFRCLGHMEICWPLPHTSPIETHRTRTHRPQKPGRTTRGFRELLYSTRIYYTIDFHTFKHIHHSLDIIGIKIQDHSINKMLCLIKIKIRGDNLNQITQTIPLDCTAEFNSLSPSVILLSNICAEMVHHPKSKSV